jgi:hypothetical protein
LHSQYRIIHLIYGKLSLNFIMSKVLILPATFSLKKMAGLQSPVKNVGQNFYQQIIVK